jgi:Leucine-rich repeat (LRR) protein
MQTFIKSSYINCDTKSLFDFHLDTNNLTKITPTNIKAEATTIILSQNIFTLIVGMGFNYQGYGLTIADSGLFLSSYAQFGLSFLLKYDFFALIMFIVIILSKLSIIYPILWIYFALIVSKSNILKYVSSKEKYYEK